MRMISVVVVMALFTVQGFGFQNEEALKTKNAWKASPGDVALQFAWASVAPCSVSVKLFNAVAVNKRAPDSLRAEAYRQLGDYSFVHSAFKTAAQKYEKAFALFSLNEYEYYRAKALAALGDTAVDACLQRLCSLSDKELSNRSKMLLASVLMKRGAYDSAYQVLSFTEAVNKDWPYLISALALKKECAQRTGKKKAVTNIDRKITSGKGALLEKDQLDHSGAVAATGTPTVRKKVVQPKEDDLVFTLQVGAFGSADNAEALRKKLGKTFDEVTILPVTIAGTVIYRVRVGRFATKYEADVFGNDSLTSAGYSFRSVVK